MKTLHHKNSIYNKGNRSAVAHSEDEVAMMRERVIYFALLGSYFLYLLMKQLATNYAARLHEKILCYVYIQHI